MTPDELNELIDESVVGAISSADRARLLQALEHDDAGRAVFERRLAAAAVLDAGCQPPDPLLLPPEARDLLLSTGALTKGGIRAAEMRRAKRASLELGRGAESGLAQATAPLRVSLTDLKQVVHEVIRDTVAAGPAVPSPRRRPLAVRVVRDVLAAGVLVLLGATGIFAINKTRDAEQSRVLLSDANTEISQLRNKNTELTGKIDVVLTELEKLRMAIPPKRPTPDANRQQFDRGRECTMRESEVPDELVLQLSPFLAPPYYSGLEVNWGDGGESDQEKVYHRGYSQLKPLITHKYKLPPPGDQRRITVRLSYWVTGYAMQQFKLRADVMVESIPLVLTSKGIRVATGRAIDAVSAAITDPIADGNAVTGEFTLEMMLQASRQLKTPAGQSVNDRVIQVLIRPIDGPEALQRFYTVQPFIQSVAALLEVGGTNEQRRLAQATLPGAIENPRKDESPPTKFEIVVVELPKLLISAVVAKDLMDFSDPQLEQEAVRARRIVSFQPRAKLRQLP